MGIKRVVKGDLMIFVGNRRLMERERMELSSALSRQAQGWEEKGKTPSSSGGKRKFRGSSSSGIP